jgi:hypothetical protein
VYLTKWRFNDSLFWLVHAATGDLDRARHICTAGIVLGTVWVATRRWRIEEQIFWSLGLLLLLSPQLDPWRLMWIVPFLAMRMRLSWLVLTGTIVLSYHPFVVQGLMKGWVEVPLFKLLEFVPFYAVALVEIAASIRARLQGATLE